jgi:alkanesulfonate monooxygenase SsuD/methylene tetrahydromethanopterin reductase-like flavin-dependent oxidoreductase (luciferase family)
VQTISTTTSSVAASVTADTVADRADRGELSIFLATPAAADPRRTYQVALDSILAAEALGYSYAWVAEAHFNTHIALPAALTFLAAAAQATDRIKLGTAVVPLAFDHPIRLAESAALVDTLSDHRLEFGVGKGNPRGFSTDAYNAFGLDEGERNEIFARALEAVKAALAAPLVAGGNEVSIYPPAPDLLGRIWQATGDHATATAAGRAGDGLMLFRTVKDGIAGELQSPVIDSYLEQFDHSAGDPRIGISRSLLIAGSREEAIAAAAADFEARTNDHPFAPESLDATSVEAFLIDLDVVFGSAEDVVEALNRDAAVVRSTNYLFNLPYTEPGSSAYKESLEIIATQVHPHLRSKVS